MKFIQLFRVILIILLFISPSSCSYGEKKRVTSKKDSVIVYDDNDAKNGAQGLRRSAEQKNRNTRENVEAIDAKASKDTQNNSNLLVIPGAEVNVGVLLPLSGKYQAWGQEIKDSLLLSQADQEGDSMSNNNGAESGKMRAKHSKRPRFVLYFIDSGSETDMVSSEALNAVEEDRFDAVIGPVFLGQTKFLLKNHAFSDDIPVFSFSSSSLLTKIPESAHHNGLLYGLGVDFLDKLRIGCDHWYFEHKQCHKFVYYLPSNASEQGDAAVANMFDEWMADKERLLYRNVDLELSDSNKKNDKVTNKFSRYFTFIVEEQKKYDMAIAKKGGQHKSCRAIAIVVPDMDNQLSIIEKAAKNSKYLNAMIVKNQLTFISAKKYRKTQESSWLHSRILFKDLGNEGDRSEFKALFTEHYHYAPGLLAYLAYDSFSLLQNAFYRESGPADTHADLAAGGNDLDADANLGGFHSGLKIEGYDEIVNEEREQPAGPILFDKQRLQGKFKGLSGSFRIEKNRLLRDFVNM